MTRVRIDSPPATAGTGLYVGSNDGKFYVMDTATGKTVQEFDAGGPIDISPALAGGRVVFGTVDGKLFCPG
jgi:outer membrane protein assembly factor BamB